MNFIDEITRYLETTLILKNGVKQFWNEHSRIENKVWKKAFEIEIQWKRKKMKLLKDSGKEYITYTGALKPAKKLIDLSCKCKYHCQAKLRKSKAVYRLNSKSTYTEEER